MGILADTLIRQFDRHWEMLIDGVKKVPDDEWHRGPTHFLVPARLAFHFVCPLEQALYLLRHTQYHHGQIDAEMHRRGCPSADWC